MVVAKGKIVFVAGPSGVGKGTLLNHIRSKYPDRFAYSISHTSRQPREGEQNGVQYFFVSKEEFQKKIENSDFLEYTETYNKFYGTSISEINRLFSVENKIGLLEIDSKGIQNIQTSENHRQISENSVFIFIFPKSEIDLKNRLVGRGTETDDVIQKRFDASKQEIEILKTLHSDFVIINDELEQSKQEIENIFNKLFKELNF